MSDILLASIGRNTDGQPKSHISRPRRFLEVRVRDGSGPWRTERITEKRLIWALQELISVGAQGLTTLERPALRWSSYVHKLRKLHGLNIETQTERHGPPFEGSHGRYVLRSRVVVIEGSDRRSA